MRFVAGGPSIPDDLLIARDLGDVIFFCGAGISQEKAGLPGFTRLGRDVIRILGSAQDSPARRLLDKAIEIGEMAGVGGLLPTDRVFGLLEREFEVGDVRAAVAEAIKPPEGYGLEAHRILLDLATSRAGVTRLITTNFDLLFEECDPALPSSGPPYLPDPQSDRDFRGIIHLHGRVDRCARDDEFVVSSADFGRAYLSDGWATRFIQSLLKRFQIVFVGYTADDPPVQYLLEALNLGAGSRSRLYAFQAGESSEAAALWERRGVQAIHFDGSNGFAPLWNTLAAWSVRARDVNAWYAELLSRAQPGPAALDPHIRGQIAHVISTREGAKRIATAERPIDASWLLVFDPRHRYGTPVRIEPYDKASDLLDPFERLGLDFDLPPEPTPADDRYYQRVIPEGAWDPFAHTRLDQEEARELTIGEVRGPAAGATASLPPRLASIGVWIQRVAHMPMALWWVAQQSALHPRIKQSVASWLRQDPARFPDDIRKGWRLLFAASEDERLDPNIQFFEVQSRARHEGWSQALVRQLVAIYRPRLKVGPTFAIRHPLSWTNSGVPADIVSASVEYPHPDGHLDIPPDHIAYAVSQFRGNLEFAISLELEIRGGDYLRFETTRPPDDGPPLRHDSYGLTGPIVMFQDLMNEWAKLAPAAARDEVKRWPACDQHIFARLRIWAAGHPVLTPTDAGDIFLTLPDQVFWGSLHERDLLCALRDRWVDLPEDARAALEDRLRTGAYPWSDDVRGGVEKAATYDRLSRLYWLSRQGVAFSFDVNSEIERLRVAAPEWTTRAGDEAANSRAPVSVSIETDESADALQAVPISEILREASEAGRRDFFDRVQREPFRGLSKRRPVRALGALTHVGRKGEAPRSAWSAFLYADTRPHDPVRMIKAIAGRLIRLPIEQFKTITYPVSEWMQAIATRLYHDSASVLDPLWNRMIAALELDHQDRHSERSWADAALNAPVGKLVNLLLKDPAKDGLARNSEFPSRWTAKVEQLLNLPGDLRRHALVMFGFQVNWLYYVDPRWTERVLLPAVEDEGEDGDAFWDGVFWAARIPSLELFERLKAGLFSRAQRVHTRRSDRNVLASMLLSGWLSGEGTEGAGKSVSDTQLREILIHTDDELRGQFIWCLKQLLTTEEGKWRSRIIPFLRDVWPKQRALRNPAISARLVDLALTSGDLMPELVELILPRLVPVRGSFFPIVLQNDEVNNPAIQHPKATLDLLWAALAEDPRDWPYQIEHSLNYLAAAPETSADPRLSELRRRRER